MNHLEVYQYEIYVPAKERNWMNWADAVEKHLGHSLDGDLNANGYSLDRAYSWFLLGVDWLEYAKEVKRMSNYNPHTSKATA